MTDIQILQEFKDNLISFIDELIEQFPDVADLIIIRIFLKDQVPMTDVVNKFIDHFDLKPMIKARDDNVFLEHDILFESLDKKRVNHFQKIWLSERLDDEDRTIMWCWMDSFIYLAEKYDKIVNSGLN
jgi:hypothetical protein